MKPGHVGDPTVLTDAELFLGAGGLFGATFFSQKGWNFAKKWGGKVETIAYSYFKSGGTFWSRNESKQKKSVEFFDIEFSAYIGFETSTWMNTWETVWNTFWGAFSNLHGQAKFKQNTRMSPAKKLQLGVFTKNVDPMLVP